MGKSFKDFVDRLANIKEAVVIDYTLSDGSRGFQVLFVSEEDAETMVDSYMSSVVAVYKSADELWADRDREFVCDNPNYPNDDPFTVRLYLLVYWAITERMERE